MGEYSQFVGLYVCAVFGGHWSASGDDLLMTMFLMNHGIARQYLMSVCMCQYVCASVCMHVSMCVCQYACVSVSLCVSMRVCVCVCVSMHVWQYVCVSVCIV